MKDIKVLMFSCYSYNFDDLSKMTDKERYYLASVAATVGYDEADILTLSEFQRQFNFDEIDANNLYIFFYQEG